MDDDARVKLSVEQDAFDSTSFPQTPRHSSARHRTMPTARASTRTIVKRDHVICELPLELEALPGEQIRFEGLDTESPTLRTMDGRRYVGRYILGVGETLVIGMDESEERKLEAGIVATAERRLRFAPAGRTASENAREAP